MRKSSLNQIHNKKYIQFKFQRYHPKTFHASSTWNQLSNISFWPIPEIYLSEMRHKTARYSRKKSIESKLTSCLQTAREFGSHTRTVPKASLFLMNFADSWTEWDRHRQRERGRESETDEAGEQGEWRLRNASRELPLQMINGPAWCEPSKLKSMTMYAGGGGGVRGGELELVHGGRGTLSCGIFHGAPREI